MTYMPGDEVHVESFGRGVVRDVRNGGRYLVDVKGRSMIVAGGRLSAAAPGRKRLPAVRATPQGVPDSIARAHAATSLDLHGLTVEEAIAALDVFLDNALRAAVPEVRLIHGRSGGRLKSAVHARLERLQPVRQFRLEPGNPGVTIVSL